MRYGFSRVARVGFLAAICAGLWGAATFEELSSRARAARAANDIPHAIDLYKQALTLNPSWQEGWWFLGTLLYDGDQYQDGQAAFQHLVDLDPKAGPAWALLGLCEFETGAYDKSLADIQRGLTQGGAKEPQMEQVLLFHEALLLTRTGQFDLALQKYAVFARAGASNDLLLTGLGLAAMHVKLLPNEIPPDRRDLFLQAGKTAAFVLAGDYSHADVGFGDLLRMYPAAPNLHYMHGVYLLARDPDTALDEFKRELQIAPSNPDASTMLAWALLIRGDSAAALPYAQTAAQNAPAGPLAQYVLGRALVETGDLKEGLEHLQRAEKMDAGNFDTHVTLAAAYSRMGDPQEARRERQIALDLAKGKGQGALP